MSSGDAINNFYFKFAFTGGHKLPPQLINNLIKLKTISQDWCVRLTDGEFSYLFGTYHKFYSESIGL